LNVTENSRDIRPPPPPAAAAGAGAGGGRYRIGSQAEILDGLRVAAQRERAAVDILALERNGCAFASLDSNVQARWTAPVILEALIPGRMQSHASTAKYPEELRERAAQMVPDIREREGKGRGEVARVGRRVGPGLRRVP
jgi:hypothetical protein